jgi:putative ABC transport system ATP-binding protein
MPPVYRLRKVIKSRTAEGIGFRLVVRNLEIAAGDKIALVGESGCGKSTLLDMLAMVLRPSEAKTFEFAPGDAPPADVTMIWARRDLNRLTELRKRHIGYVLQTGGLLPYLTVRENMELSRRFLALPADDTVDMLARQLGIGRQLDKLPGFLSAGERQRVAIGRALAHRPSIVIADEPTASLDPITARNTMTLLMELVDGFGITAIVASHDWAQVDRLGLRKLPHLSSQRAGGSLIESVVTD